jgi:hypothetical protein
MRAMGRLRPSALGRLVVGLEHTNSVPSHVVELDAIVRSRGLR